MIPMKDVNYIIGSKDILNTPLPVYSDEAISFAGDLSAAVLKAEGIRRYPDVVSFAFWCRKGNIEKLKADFGEVGDRLGRGLVFHVAPGNIPVNFAFTYMFGVFAGCANIVRLPSRRFPQTEQLLGIIKDTLKNYPEIEKRTAFVRYEADDETTESFSKAADVRMIWGGDRTVGNIKRLEAKPRCIDITFADRYSVCLLNGDEVNSIDDNELKKLADAFYNDTYLMDQNACSSPQMMYWMNDSSEARDRFWNAVYETAKDRYFLQDAVGVDKYTKLCQDAVEYEEIIDKSINRDNLLYRVEIKKGFNSQKNEDCRIDPTDLRGKGGYFYETSIDDLSDIFDVVTEKYQTLTYFGVDSSLLRDAVIKSNLRGIDRIVPIGKALDIGVIWDGYDLVRNLSRIVSLA